MNHTHASVIKLITSFLNDIGITTTFDEVPADKSFVPGIWLKNGGLIIDVNELKYPGDLLHEAAHIAVIKPEERLHMDGVLETNTDKSAGEEMMALAWSYAAAVHINLDPNILFHEHGYKGQAQELVYNYRNGVYIGLPMLQWVGLAADYNKANELGIEPYPKMIKWLRD